MAFCFIVLLSKRASGSLLAAAILTIFDKLESLSIKGNKYFAFSLFLKHTTTVIISHFVVFSFSLNYLQEKTFLARVNYNFASLVNYS